MPRPALGGQPAGRIGPSAEPVPRAAPRPRPTEASGEAIGLALVYSGNFLAQAEVDPFGTVAAAHRASTRGRSAGASSPASPSRSPEAVLAWTDEGLGGLSDAFHRPLPRAARPRDVARPPPADPPQQLGGDVLRLRRGPARGARDRPRATSGVELFVLDDGWFGRRDDDTSSLGDWFVDERKLPGGLARLAERVNALGLDFGLWIEPEMVSPRSELSRRIPTGPSACPAGPGPSCATSTSSTCRGPRSWTTSSRSSATSSAARRSPT